MGVPAVWRREGTSGAAWLRRSFLLAAALESLTPVPAGAATYSVGPGRPYPTISSLPSLSPGDIVEIDPGTYNEVKRWTANGTVAQPITIRGVGASRPVLDGTGFNLDGVLPRPRAIFQIEGNHYVIENLEFRNADGADNNGAGLRILGVDDTTIRACKVTDSNMGIMSSGNDNLLIEASEIAFNGTARSAGYTHNLYLGGGKTTIRFCYVHDALFGQNVKTRGHYTELLYSYVADSNEGEITLVGADETGLPNSNAVLIGNIVISKSARTGNQAKFIEFGDDIGSYAHNGTAYVINNTLVAGSSAIEFLWSTRAEARIEAVNNIFYGSNTVVGFYNLGGMSGTNNWMPETATVPPTFSNTTRGGDPGFVNGGSRDYHLTASASARNIGLGAPSYRDEQGVLRDGVPRFEYVTHLQGRPRPADGQLDAGAYEYETIPSPTSFYTVAPCRIADTRNPPGPSGGPALGANTNRTFPVTGLCSIPSTAKAVAIILAVVTPNDSGDLRLYPTGVTAPLASSINFRPGIVRANNAVIPLGTGGQISVQCDMPIGSSGSTHLVIDVYGYFQ